jgi:adenylate cyclase
VRTNFQLNGYLEQRLWRSLAAGLAIVLCGLVLVSTPLGGPFQRLELGWLFWLRGARPQPPDVAVVEINNKTAEELGFKADLEPKYWPSVTVHARLIERLVCPESGSARGIDRQTIAGRALDPCEQLVPHIFGGNEQGDYENEARVDLNAGGIVFDILFEDSKPGDDALRLAITRADRVILSESWKKETIITKGQGNGGSVDVMRLPIDVLARAAKAHGPSVLPIEGGRTDFFWTFLSAGDTPTTAALALQLRALAVYEDWLAALKRAARPDVDRLPACAEDVADVACIVDHLPARAEDVADMQQLMQTFRRMFQQDGSLQQKVIRAIDEIVPRSDVTARQLLTALVALYAGPAGYFINFYGPPGTIRPISYQSFLKAGICDYLSNNMIFVGRSDHQQIDRPDRWYTRSTNNAIDLSGTEIMATAYANLLSGRTLTPSPFSALAVVAFGLVAWILAYLLPATAAMPALVATTAFYAGLLHWRFNEADLWLPLATPVLVQLPIALLSGLMWQYLLKRRKEEQMTKAIGYYLPENLVRDLAQRQVDPTTLNRVVFGTCLATDMSDFMSLAESKPPRELAVFMNEYFDALAQALKRHGVDVMEFRADMIMCAWIDPARSAVVCRKGIEAAIEVSEIITRFAQQYGSRHFNPRVGLQDGEVYVGHTGGGGRFLYSIVGDTANTAARLESLNKHLGTHVLAAESVVQDANGLLLRPLGWFRLRGKADPTSIIEILGRKESASAEHLDLCARFAEGLAVFQRKEWERAASLFEAITKSYDDGPSRFYWAHSQKYAALASNYDGPALIHMYEK